MDNFKICGFLLAPVLLAGCSSDVSEVVDFNTEAEGATLVLKVDVSDMENEIAQLDSLGSLSVPVEVEDCYGDVSLLTRAVPITELTGTVTNMGNGKVVFRPNSGQNLVPSYLCGTGLGQAVIATAYRIGVKIKVEEDMFVKGLEGQYSGWSSVRVVNTQEQRQYRTESEVEPEFYTFCYHILSNMDGWTLPDGGFKVPYPKEQIRLYVQIAYF